MNKTKIFSLTAIALLGVAGVYFLAQLCSNQNLPLVEKILESDWKIIKMDNNRGNHYSKKDVIDFKGRRVKSSETASYIKIDSIEVIRSKDKYAPFSHTVLCQYILPLENRVIVILEYGEGVKDKTDGHTHQVYFEFRRRLFKDKLSFIGLDDGTYFNKDNCPEVYSDESKNVVGRRMTEKDMEVITDHGMGGGHAHN